MNEIKAEALLVNPPSRSISDRPPLHFMYMASYNEMKGIPTEIIDIKSFNREGKQEIEDKIIDAIAKSGARIVGFTCTTPEITEVKRLASRTKEALGKDTITLVGGIHATVLPQELVVESDIDFALTGEAEKTFSELVRSEDPYSVKGLVYANNGGIKSTDSTSNQYVVLTGTSMAAPHVSGALAVIISNFPNLSNPPCVAIT